MPARAKPTRQLRRPCRSPNGPDSAFGPEISAEDFSAHVKILASDEFAGRQPGSAGEEKTVEYLREQFQRLGLEPGNGDSYFQTVPMIETRAEPGASKMTVRVAGKTHELAFGEQMVIGTHTGQAEVRVDASPMVFVGYGVNAPEAGLGRLRRPGCKGQDGGHADQRPGLPQRRRQPVRGPAHDLLRSLDLQVRGGRAPRRRPRRSSSTTRPAPATAGTW